MKEEGSNRGSSAFSSSLRYPTLPKNATVWFAVVVTLISGLTLLGAAGQAEKELLLVVGDVSDHTARVLYEGYHALGQKGEETMIASLIDETTASLIVDTVIQVRTFPAVLKLADLLPEHNYSVSFYSFSSGRENPDVFRGQVFFRTFPSHSTAPVLFKVAALSCNRWYDDRDVELWEKLALLDNDSDVMLHLGDNIYADRIWKDFISYLSQVPENSAEWETRRAEATYEYFLPKYRHIYRETFGQETVQKVLRRNAHWIITDDHEFVNNFGPDLLKDPVLAPMVWAGRTAFLEYQMQLLMDIEPAVMYFQANATANANAHVPTPERQEVQTYYAKTVGKNLVFIFLDLRYQRSFEFDVSHPMIGSKQLRWFQEQLAKYGSDDSITDIVVSASVPLLYFTESMAKLTYAVEQETYPTHPNHINDTLLLMEMLLPHAPKVKLLGGDVHQFALLWLCHERGPCIPEMVTSGITRGSSIIEHLKLYLFYLLGLQLTNDQVGNWHVMREQQVGFRNYGVLYFQQRSDADSSTSWRWEGRFPDNIPTKHLLLQWIFDHFLILLSVLVGALIALCIFSCGHFSQKRP